MSHLRASESLVHEHQLCKRRHILAGLFRFHDDVRSLYLFSNIVYHIMAILQQRPTKGARISTFYPVKTVPPLASLDSAFQLQEYISLLIRQDPHDVERIVSIPGRRSGKEREGSDDMREEKDTDSQKGDGVVDEPSWIYEQLRCVVCNTAQETPHLTACSQDASRRTCPIHLSRLCNKNARVKHARR